MVIRRPSPSTAIFVVLLLHVALSHGPPAGAVTDAGSAGAVPSPRTVPTYPPVTPGTYAPPVDAPVSDPFRMDAGPYGAGNRGLEYAGTSGRPVRAVAAGRVAFAGPVAGRLVVSIDHPDGRRSSLTGLAGIEVRVGDLVARGTVVGTGGPMLHLGLREGRRYVDPAAFFGEVRRHAVLVPIDPGVRPRLGPGAR